METRVAFVSPEIKWLLTADEPAVRYLTLTGLLEGAEDDPQTQTARAHILDGAWVSRLLAGQQADGGFGVGPYQKWAGAA